MTLLEHNENKTPVSDRHPHDRNGERQQSSVSPNPKPSTGLLSLASSWTG